MAKRCPESRYIGTAKLHDFRFQINERGFANIVPSSRHSVEGLVYRLNQTDEAKLDKNEGVPTAYQKYIVLIEVFTAAIELVARAVPELAKEMEASEPRITALGASEESIGSHIDPRNYSHQPVYENNSRRLSASKRRRSRARGHTRHDRNDLAGVEEQIDIQPGYDNSRQLQDHSLTLRGQFTKVLVYLSSNYVQDSKPRDEYVDRMNAGIIDARRLGVSEIYIEDCLRRYIPVRALPSQDSPSAQRIAEDRYYRSRRSWNSSPTTYILPGSRHRPRVGSVRSKSVGPTVDRGER